MKKEYFGFIYEWIDSTNGKNYVGSHKGSIEDKYEGSGILFKRSFKKRPETFTREILEYVFENNKKILLEVEQKYLDLIDWTNTYNISTITRGGNGMKGKSAWNKGIPMSEEAKQNQSEKMKDKVPWNKGLKTGPQSKEIKLKKSNSMRGRAAWNKGIPCTEEAKRKNSESHKGEKNHFYGKHHTEESKQRQSNSLKGKKRGPYKKKN